MDSDNESNSSNHSLESEEDVISQEERQSIKNKISSMSFEDLQKLKAKIGSKLYTQTLHGATKKQGAKTDFKRANKNRPREVSSKIKVRLVERPSKAKKVIPRDPRFDPLCGTYDEKSFKSNYKFIKDVKKKEKAALEKEHEECEDPAQKEKIKFVIQRLDNQIREQEKKEERDRREYEEKTEIRDQLKKGEKPEYKKKSVKKIEELVHKYEDLKKHNKLQKHIERKQKKLNQKDAKQMKKLNTHKIF